jgi:hypothetical protein
MSTPESLETPKCPKCSLNNSYLFCKECETYYCIACCINYYEDKETKKVIDSHNPHCNKEDDTSITSFDLSDYE